MNNHTLDQDIHDLLDPHKGYILKRAFLTSDQVDRYRQECAAFLRTTRRVYKKINRYSKHDHVRSTNRTVAPGAFTYRILQSLHAKHSDDTEKLFRRVVALRNEIERNWLSNAQYRTIREGLYDYVQVSAGGKRSPGIARHCDYKGPAPYPFLQPLIFLSEPGVDYLGGELVLHTKTGELINSHTTLNLRKGDALLFDKSLDHEVAPTEPSELSGVGRWTAVIGARCAKPPSVYDRLRRFFLPIACRA